MAIILRLDRVMADRKISLKRPAPGRVGISTVNLSNLKTGKVKAIRFSTLDAICQELALSTRRYFGVQTNGENDSIYLDATACKGKKPAKAA